MKRSELEKKLGKLEVTLSFIKNNESIHVFDVFSNCIAFINDEEINVFSVYHSINKLPEKVRLDSIELIIEYATTPLAEREDDEKFYIRHKWLIDPNSFQLAYLNQHKPDKFYYPSNKTENSRSQTKFTKKEIEKLKKVLNTDLSDYEIIKVEEVESGK